MPEQTFKPGDRVRCKGELPVGTITEFNADRAIFVVEYEHDDGAITRGEYPAAVLEIAP